MPDAASLDKVNKEFDQVFSKPGMLDAFQALTERDGHRDYMTRLRYMVSK